MFGKTFTQEHRNKIREAKKGHLLSEETRNKIGEAMKGENNPFYGKHFSTEHKKKLGEAHKGNKNNLGTHWFNNGKICIRAKECPEGFVPGMLRK